MMVVVINNVIYFYCPLLQRHSRTIARQLVRSSFAWTGPPHPHLPSSSIITAENSFCRLCQKLTLAYRSVKVFTVFHSLIFFWSQIISTRGISITIRISNNGKCSFGTLVTHCGIRWRIEASFASEIWLSHVANMNYMYLNIDGSFAIFPDWYGHIVEGKSLYSSLFLLIQMIIAITHTRTQIRTYSRFVKS